MKYSWMILSFCLLLGCKESEYYRTLRTQQQRCTISTSFYCITVLHDEHLFIMSNSGYFLHHPDCMCCKIKVVEKAEEPPVIINFGRTNTDDTVFK